MPKWKFDYTVINTGKRITVTVDDQSEANSLREMVSYCRGFHKDVSKVERVQ